MNKYLFAVLLIPVLGQAQLAPEIVKSCKDRNVLIETHVGRPTKKKGSGIKIGFNRILSAYHVVAGRENSIVVDGKPARVLKTWRERDLVLLYADLDEDVAPVQLIDHMPDDEVILVGNPKSSVNKVMYGAMIGSKNSPIYDPGYTGPVWLSDVLGLPGGSGGGVWNREGRLVGVFKGWEEYGDISIIVPAGEVKKFLESEMTFRGEGGQFVSGLARDAAAADSSGRHSSQGPTTIQ